MSAARIRVLRGAHEIAAADWERCANPPHESFDPFLSHDFFCALEQSGSVSLETGWAAQHLLLEQGGEIRGILPLYLKNHSQGEYIFDHGWAEAFARAGGRYYPKLLSAVPFTPASGRRLLIAPQADMALAEQQLIGGALELLERCGASSLHLNFLTAPQYETLGALGFLQRTDQQFHWQNHGYADFDAFLAALASRKRKNLKKERARALENGISVKWLCGAALEPAHWDAFFTFYTDTGARKWGTPYLTRDFFRRIHASMGEHILLVMAERAGRPIAAALNFIGDDTLFGRHWGCIEDHPFLHFELCYYQAIDFAIARGLKRVEAGAQGPHKLLRGYVPCRTHSAHYIANPHFRDAVADYLTHERAQTEEAIEALDRHTPFRKTHADENNGGKNGPK